MARSSGQLTQIFPEFYRNFLPEFFKSPAPGNKAAPCHDCPMTPKPRAREGAFSFSPKTKCCTHYPALPNYLVGAILSSRSKTLTEGRRRIRRVIRSRVGVTPRGVMPPAKRLLFMKQAPDAFGRSVSLRCPFLDVKQGLCTLTPLWNAICKTWFCRYDDGEDGALFWSALCAYWVDMERQLARHALREMGWDPTKIVYPDPTSIVLSATDVDEAPIPLAEYRAVWDTWAGREEPFYKRTYRIIRALDRRAYARMCGVTQRAQLDAVAARYQQVISPVLPERLKRASTLVVDRMADGRYIITAYSPYHPITLSARFYRLLDFFDGRAPTDDVRRTIRRTTGIHLNERFILALYRFRILVEA